MPKLLSTRMFTRLAPLIFVILWSTGFIGAKFGLPYVQPFTFLALRMSIVAALLLILVAIWARKAWQTLSTRAILHSAVVGLLLHVVYLWSGV